MSDPRAVLAFDFASFEASAAVAREGRLLATASCARDGAGEPPDPLALVAGVLARAGLGLEDVATLLALCGPGSFTGLRVACATALGLAQATGLPAAGVPSLEALALAAPPGSGTVLAAVDALRGEWFVQRFARGPRFEAAALDQPRLARPGEAGLLDGVDLVVGRGAAAHGAETGATAHVLEPTRIADAVACAGSLGGRGWAGARLVHPLYLRAPAITVPS
ncbi:MAG: tsaB [Acidobacteria bacterium]|nr:tsaB [Acidobacteriota bacterium]